MIRLSWLFVISCFLAACTIGSFRDSLRTTTTPDLPWPMEGAGPQRNRATAAQITPPLSPQDKFVIGGDTELGSPVSVTADMLFADRRENKTTTKELENGRTRATFRSWAGRDE